MNEESEILVNVIKNRFEESVNALDAATLTRIRQIRTQVIEKSENKSKKYKIWIPAGAFASVSMAFLIYGIVPQKTAEDQTFIDEIDIISDLDLYENLDFYDWLEQYELPS
jgi:hypothetical protein